MKGAFSCDKPRCFCPHSRNSSASFSFIDEPALQNIAAANAMKTNANTRIRLEARFRLCGVFLQNFAWLDRLSKSAPHNVHRHRRKENRPAPLGPITPSGTPDRSDRGANTAQKARRSECGRKAGLLRWAIRVRFCSETTPIGDWRSRMRFALIEDNSGHYQDGAAVVLADCAGRFFEELLPPGPFTFASCQRRIDCLHELPCRFRSRVQAVFRSAPGGRFRPAAPPQSSSSSHQ